MPPALMFVLPFCNRTVGCSAHPNEPGRYPNFVPKET